MGSHWRWGLVSECGPVLSVSYVDTASGVTNGWSTLAECRVLSRGLSPSHPTAHYPGGRSYSSPHLTHEQTEVHISALVPRSSLVQG